MNLSHLQYFRELSKTQSYTKAARNLYISQPTLSHSIATLEEELECKLFRKAGRGIVLTDEGKLFSNYVDDSLRVLEKGIIELEKKKGASFWNSAPWSNPIGTNSFSSRSNAELSPHTWNIGRARDQPRLNQRAYL